MLILLLVIAVGIVPILENPVSTLINCHPKFRLVVKLLQDKGIGLPTSLYPEAVEWDWDTGRQNSTWSLLDEAGCTPC